MDIGYNVMWFFRILCLCAILSFLLIASYILTSFSFLFLHCVLFFLLVALAHALLLAHPPARSIEVLFSFAIARCYL